MSRIDLRFTFAHPLRWGKAVGFQLAIATLLVAKAVLLTDPLWDITVWSHIGPITLAFAAAMCLASAVAPADGRLQVATMLVLLAVAVWRAAVYGMVVAADLGNTATVLAQAFALHWLIVAAIATRWPVLSTQSALIVTVEAGRERLRAAG